ncbi:MAG: hypothetical protein RIS47_1499, partial [Bacteroidota bacterium]
YSYTKRFTALCHFVLGLGLSLAPIGAYLAVTAEFALTPLLFSILVLFWVSGFDIIYALQDDQFDLSQKLKSVPVLLGRKGALLLSQILHLAAAILVTYIGLYNNFPASYWFGGILFIGLLIYQHSLVKPHDLRKVDMAFFTTNGIASVSYAIFVIWTLLS